MGRVRTRISADLTAASKNRRQKTDLHGTSKKGVDRSKIAASALEIPPPGAREIEASVSECCLWSYNDRIYDSLNMENCKSLVDDIEKNGQLQPVIARKDPTGRRKYEIIIGTRRYWACQHTVSKTIKLQLVEADDRLAYRMMRSENAQRNDTTAYEKAVNAKRVIAQIYGGSQKDYCLENDIPEQTLSDWMAIADMEPEILAVLPDKMAITVKQSTKLRRLMNKGAKSKKAILEKTASIKGEGKSTKEILNALIRAGEDALTARRASAKQTAHKVGSVENAVTVKADSKGDLTIKINHQVKGESDEILRIMKQYLKQ